MPQAIYLNAKLSSPLENMCNIYLELFTCCNLRHFKSVVDKKAGKREKRNSLCLYQAVSSSVCCRAAILLMTSHGSDTDFINTLLNFFFREICLGYYFNFFPIKPSTKSVKASHVKLHTKIKTDTI